MRGLFLAGAAIGVVHYWGCGGSVAEEGIGPVPLSAKSLVMSQFWVERIGWQKRRQMGGAGRKHRRVEFWV